MANPLILPSRPRPGATIQVVSSDHVVERTVRSLDRNELVFTDGTRLQWKQAHR